MVVSRAPQLPPDDGRTPEGDDQLVFADLSRPVSAPDLTRPIMGRLGYMRVSDTRARRLRIRRWASRAGLTCASAIAIAIGWKMYLDGPDIRRPSGPTIPSAIGHDVLHQQHKIGAILQTIRNLAPRTEPSDSQVQPMNDPDAAPAQDAPEAPGVDEDVNQSSIAPVRWV